MSAVDNKRPFMGLRPFREVDHEHFHGRDAAVQELFRHVRRQALSVLFGRSGLGKTSILQAGLLPELRDHRFLPVTIRIQTRMSEQSLLDLVRTRIAEELETQGVDADIPGKEETLWEYFHRTLFWNSLNHPLTPVLVFDQFEEFFTLNISRDGTGEFLESLADLAENRIPSAVRRRIEEQGEELLAGYEIAKVKVILSLREDHLADLEGLREIMPTLITNRYRLTHMSGENAMEAIRNPAGDLVEEAVAEQIVRFVAGAGEGETVKASETRRLHELQVEPALLSLFCFELNERRIEDQQLKISADLLEGSRSEIINDFYRRTVRGAKIARVFIEDRLLTKGGHRTLVAEADALAEGLSQTQIDRLVSRRLLRRQDLYGTPHIEIIHDVLRDPIRSSRNRRRLLEGRRVRERARSKLRWKRVKIGMSVLIGLFLLTMLLGIYILYQSNMKSTRRLSTVYQDRGRELLNKQDHQKALVWLSEAYRLWEQSIYLGSAPNSLRLLVNHAANLSAAELSRSLTGHKEPVVSVAFNGVGNQIVTASQDSTAKIWDLKTGKLRTTLEGHSNSVEFAAFSPDGHRVITASGDNTARIWDADTGNQLAGLIGHTGQVVAAAFSIDGERIVTSSWDRTAIIWDVKTAKPLSTLAAHKAPVVAAAFNRDGDRIVTASWDKTAIIWDWEKNLPLAYLVDHDGPVDFAMFSPDGKRVVTASQDKTAMIWDAETGKRLINLEDHTERVVAAKFIHGGDWVMTASRDKTVKVWEVKTGRPLTNFQCLAGEFASAAFSPDGDRVVTALQRDNKTAMVWPVKRTGRLSLLKGPTKSIVAARFNRDCERVITASEEKTASIWDIGLGEELVRLTGHTAKVVAAAYSIGGNRVVTASWDHTAKIWDVKTARSLITLEGHTKPVVAVAFSEEGGRIATASWDKTAKIWDVDTGKELISLVGHKEQVVAVALCNDCDRVATASWDHTAKIWDMKTGELLTTLKGHTSNVVYVAFSPDSERIVTTSSDETAKIWDAKTGELLSNLEEHANDVAFAMFSPDSKRVITASLDKTAKIWDVTSGDLLFTLEGHADGLVSAAFAPESERVVTVSVTGVVINWDVHLEMRSAEEIADTVKTLVPYRLVNERLVPLVPAANR